MPFQRCTTESKTQGWKWGNRGACYKTIREALRQAIAIGEKEKAVKEINQMRGSKNA